MTKRGQAPFHPSSYTCLTGFSFLWRRFLTLPRTPARSLHTLHTWRFVCVQCVDAYLLACLLLGLGVQRAIDPHGL